MNKNLWASLFTSSLLAVGTLAIVSSPSSAQTTTYFCGIGKQGVPTTYALTSTGKRIEVIRWAKTWGGQYTPEVRCEKASAEFQKAAEQGLLKYLTHGVKNRQKVICAAGEYGGPCQQILFTLRSSDDPDQVLQKNHE